MVNKVIEVRDYSYSYPDGRLALDRVNFSVEDRECLGIIGPNGAGKTTLLLSLLGILWGGGEIKIKGVFLSKKSIRKIRQIMGFVFQDPDTQLFSPTVFEDIAFGPLNMGLSPREVEKRVKDALSLVGLPGFSDRISHHLSIGEKKRVALASVLSMDPEILLFDEPLSGLDPRGKRLFTELLRDMEKTKIIATHDLLLVEFLCDRVIVLKDGQLLWQGPPSYILHRKDLLEKYGL